MFAHRQRRARQAHIFGTHHFECLAIFQHAVLVDAAFMGKGVLADDGLIELHRKAGHGSNATRNVHDLGGINAGIPRHDVVAHAQGHDDFFQCGIARTFAQSVDCAFNLARAADHGGKAVGCGHAQIVVAMGGKNNVFGTVHVGDQTRDQIGGFHRRGIADGIGNVDRGRPRLNGDFHRAFQIIPFGTRGIHR